MSLIHYLLRTQWDSSLAREMPTDLNETPGQDFGKCSTPRSGASDGAQAGRRRIEVSPDYSRICGRSGGLLSTPWVTVRRNPRTSRRT